MLKSLGPSSCSASDVGTAGHLVRKLRTKSEAKVQVNLLSSHVRIVRGGDEHLTLPSRGSATAADVVL